ncbi:hypothetical protein [uncultured Cohaesibacter sp.]|uniref:hypothetical protein n=1 Tax=uncultured Cohaesibacter sp. TaxID=1002546 RepID=UPI0029C6FF94|nr:hypothetical protein [uncultured Cohaesibacter sp.]
MPETGTVITADGKAVGTLGTVSGTSGLAIMRLDRIADALKDGIPLLAGDLEVSVTLPDYANFSLEE